MHSQLPHALLAAAFACSIASAPAHARARVFVASYGNDANPCTFLSPCKTFQQAVNVVDAGGEVTAIDSAGFGPISISQSVTITSPLGIEAGIAVPSGGVGITVSAGSSDAVQLRGLTIDGASVGKFGIKMSSGASLEIVGCVVRNFTSDGIHLAPSNTATFLIQETNASQNANAGIYISNGGGGLNIYGVVSRSTMDNNGIGFDQFATTLSSGATSSVSIVDSVASNNVNQGFRAEGDASAAFLTLHNVTASNNDKGIVGTVTSGTSTIRIGHSLITGNTTGVQQSNFSVIDSYGDNDINCNTTDVVGTLSSVSQR